jgi:hypothetical protein
MSDRLSPEAELLAEIRDLLLARGRPAPGRAMLTQNNGVEVPLIMADLPAVMPIDLVGKGPEYFGVDASADIHHFVGGELIVSVAERKPAGIFFYAAQVQIVAYVASQAVILGTGVVNTGSGPLLVPIPLNQAYTRISIGARQLVNGIPSSDSPGNNPLMAGASMFLSYAGRLYR